jgi:hypothetical protein
LIPVHALEAQRRALIFAHSGRILTHCKLRTYCRRSRPALIRSLVERRHGGIEYHLLGRAEVHLRRPAGECRNTRRSEWTIGVCRLSRATVVLPGSHVAASSPKLKSFRRSTLACGTRRLREGNHPISSKATVLMNRVESSLLEPVLFTSVPFVGQSVEHLICSTA